MTPEEQKAKELVGKYIRYTPVEFEYEYAKACALIAVDLLFEQLDLSGLNTECDTTYWQSVKQAIQEL